MTARVGQDGELVLLADQDRARWDGRLIAQGIALATDALQRGEGRLTLQAAIAGLHAIAPSWDTTDWSQVARMYDALMARWPSPVVALNRVAARSLEPGADLALLLDELDLLAYEPALRVLLLPAGDPRRRPRRGSAGGPGLGGVRRGAGAVGQRDRAALPDAAEGGSVHLTRRSDSSDSARGLSGRSDRTNR